jgi:hypothetical protein
MLLQKKSAKSLGASPTFGFSMVRTPANYIGPFSINSMISMLQAHFSLSELGIITRSTLLCPCL